MAPSIPSVGAKTRLRKHALLASCRKWSYRTTLYRGGKVLYQTYVEFIETVSELAPPRTIRSNCHHARRRQKHACENRHCSPRAKSCRIAPLHTKTGKHHRNGESELAPSRTPVADRHHVGGRIMVAKTRNCSPRAKSGHIPPLDTDAAVHYAHHLWRSV